MIPDDHVDVDLIVVIWDHGLLHWRQNFSKSFSNFGVQHRREDHIKLEDHPPLLERVPVLWHALALDLLQVASLDDLSSNSLYDESSVVKSLYCLLHAGERLSQVDVHLNNQVQTAPLEPLVRLLVQDDDDISGLQPWLLVALAAECNLLSVLHTFVHLHLQDLPLSIDLPPVTLLTTELGVGPPAQPIASITDDVLLQGQFPHSSVVHVLQGHGQLVHKIFGSSWASLTSAPERVSASEEHVENVHRIAGEPSASSHASLLDGLLSSLVVQTSLFRVGQNLIGVGDLLELLPSIRVFIRVVFEGELTVSFLQR